MLSVFLLFYYCLVFYIFLHIFYIIFFYIFHITYPLFVILYGGQISYPPCFREGQMIAHFFSGRRKCPPLFFEGGANVLPLVLWWGKCPGGEQLFGGNVLLMIA